MRKKSLVIYLIVIIGLSFILPACDRGLEVISVEIAKYPEKLFYIIGIDDSLSLDGGEVYIITKDISNGKTPKETGIVRMDDEREISIMHNIDFSMPGVYTVTCKRHVGSASFPIQVVSREEIERMME